MNGPFSEHFFLLLVHCEVLPRISFWKISFIMLVGAFLLRHPVLLSYSSFLVIKSSKLYFSSIWWQHCYRTALYLGYVMRWRQTSFNIIIWNTKEFFSSNCTSLWISSNHQGEPLNASKFITLHFHILIKISDFFFLMRFAIHEIFIEIYVRVII